MIRQKRSIRLVFPEESRSHLVDGGSRRDPGVLVVHVRPRRLSARWTPLTSMDNPPVFRGRIEPSAAGFEVNGTIRETRAAGVMPLALLGVCAAGVALFVLGLTGSGAVPITVGLLMAILFGVLFATSLRRRRPRFRLQAGRLESGIETYLRTGDAPHQRP